MTALEDTPGISLMHPCYVLIHAEDYWAFNQRPHGLVELVLGDGPVFPVYFAAND